MLERLVKPDAVEPSGGRNQREAHRQRGQHLLAATQLAVSKSDAIRRDELDLAFRIKLNTPIRREELPPARPNRFAQGINAFRDVTADRAVKDVNSRDGNGLKPANVLGTSVALDGLIGIR